jgi:hypothetical protein
MAAGLCLEQSQPGTGEMAIRLKYINYEGSYEGSYEGRYFVVSLYRVLRTDRGKDAGKYRFVRSAVVTYVLYFVCSEMPLAAASRAAKPLFGTLLAGAQEPRREVSTPVTEYVLNT